MKESVYQSSLIRTIKNILPDCIVLKLDPSYIQGIPDLIILYGITWAALEVKKSSNARRRPNQEFYVKKMNKMSYAAFIYPENTEVILNEMLDHFYRINNLNDVSLEEYKKSQFELANLLNQNIYSEVGQGYIN